VTVSPFKPSWFKKDTKNNTLVHSITAAKALQDASDLTGVPFLKSVIGGFVVILENVQVRFSVARELLVEYFHDQRVRKNDTEFNSLVDRINSVIDLLHEAKGLSEAPSKQIEKACQSFYGYLPALARILILTDSADGAEILRSSSSL
jgi:hypothetical protein